MQPFLAVAEGRSLVDRDAIGDESIDVLVNLVRIDTSNPQRKETAVVNYLKAVLR